MGRERGTAASGTTSTTTAKPGSSGRGRGNIGGTADTADTAGGGGYVQYFEKDAAAGAKKTSVKPSVNVMSVGFLVEKGD